MSLIATRPVFLNPWVEVWPVGVPILCIPTLAFECLLWPMPLPLLLRHNCGMGRDVNFGHCMGRPASQIHHKKRP